MDKRLFHNHALFKTAPGWELYRSLHLGTRGPAGSEYVAIRLSDNKRFDFSSQKRRKIWFGEAGFKYPEWVPTTEWNESMYG